MKINPGSLGFPDYYAYLHVINKIYQLFIYSLSLVFQLSAKTEKVPENKSEVGKLKIQKS